MPHAKIISDPGVMLGKPCIRGTRITVELVLRKLGSGIAIDEIVRDYPQLSEADIRAALAFAADYLENESVIAAE